MFHEGCDRAKLCRRCTRVHIQVQLYDGGVDVGCRVWCVAELGTK